MLPVRASSQGAVLGLFPVVVLVTPLLPLLPPQSRPAPKHHHHHRPGGLFTHSHASLDPLHDNQRGVYERIKTDPNSTEITLAVMFLHYNVFISEYLRLETYWAVQMQM